MLTVEENGWNFQAINLLSSFNILPIEINQEMGKIWIQRQSSKIRVFLWKFLVGCGIFHWFYIFGRLIQSTLFERKKYFRWDHFVVHFVLTILYIVFYYTAFLLFSKNKEECVLIFNHLFVQRENPVRKIMDEEKKQELQSLKWKRIREAFSTTGLDSSSVLHPVQAQSSHKDPEIWKKIESGSGSKVRPLLKWPPQYPLVELVNRLQPFLSVGSEFPAIFVLAIEPSRCQFLYSALPLKHQNVSTFSSLLAVETLFVTLFLGNIYFSTFLQLTFFGKCQLQFQRLSLQLRMLREEFQKHSLGIGGRDSKKEMWMLRQILKEIKELVFFIELFNRCFPFVIFSWKISALSTSILFYFFTVRHFQDFPFLSGFIGYCAVIISVVYAVMYGHAFSVPEKMKLLKREFLLTAQKTASATSRRNPSSNSNSNFWREMKREIGRIRNVGVKVGSFHQMERGSTPKFISYVVDQVASLLVSFPRK